MTGGTLYGRVGRPPRSADRPQSTPELETTAPPNFLAACACGHQATLKGVRHAQSQPAAQPEPGLLATRSEGPAQSGPLGQPGGIGPSSRSEATVAAC